MDRVLNDVSKLTLHKLGEDKDYQLNKMTTALRQLARFIEPARTFLNCHFTDYYLKAYWNTLIPDKLRHDLESKSVDEVKACMTDLTTGAWKAYPDAINHNENWDFSNATCLEQLIVSIGKLKLSELGLCTPYKDVERLRDIMKMEVPNLFVDLEFDAFMSSKKMHEVFKFSEFIACTCAGKDLSRIISSEGKEGNFGEIRQIVDVGSGKGYLSSFLSLYYDLQVLAIDASEINTEGCQKRLAKLDKAWPHLVRRARERQQTGTSVNMGKHWRKKIAKMGITEEEYRKSLKEPLHNSREDNLKSITEMITTRTDLQNLVDGNFPDQKSNNYGIIGLHTCGNLGANILKLFVNNERAQFICVVPCCYNLLREDESLYPEDYFYGSKFGNDGQSGPWPDGSIGFPLSKLLNSYDNGKAYVVGRNAKMLSAYSIPRMIHCDSNMEMPPVLYYRSLLQVLLMDHGLLPDNYCTSNNAHEDCDLRVGRMTKKCSTFREYVGFALRKLFPDEFPEYILTDNSIEKTEGTYASCEMLDKFHKYYLLRAMYASVIEDFILLDRLVYLLEHESIAEASVVQLFDPALSPRSHAVVAIKKP